MSLYLISDFESFGGDSVNFFDLHCDTLYKVCTEGQSLLKNGYHVSLERGKSLFSQWYQCFAVWIPDDVRGKDAVNLLNMAYKNISSVVLPKGYENVKLLFTVEGGAAVAGDLENINLLKKYGVKAMTLTWNGSCELGDGVMVENARGLTKFGRECVRRMENFGIAVDISHASENLFWDVFEEISGPVIATHSNSKKICNHKRNLSDDQFNAIKNRSGLVGLTFCDLFLKDGGNASLQDVLRHAEHFLSLGGEDVLAIGSDFDGADMPRDVYGIESVEKLYNLFLRENYNESLVRKIFFENAAIFFYKEFNEDC